MEKVNKMYSAEVVDKATSAVAMGFCCDDGSFKESLEELPEEVQAMVISSVLAGNLAIHVQMKRILSRDFKSENPTKEDIDKFFREAFENMGKEK